MDPISARDPQRKNDNQNTPVARLVTIIPLDLMKTHSEARAWARKTKCRLPALSEFVAKLKEDPGFFEECKGKRFWVDNESGIDISGTCKINYETGAVNSISVNGWVALPIGERAFAYRGDGFMFLEIHTNTSFFDRRLSIYSNGREDNIAHVALVPLTEVDIKEAKRD